MRLESPRAYIIAFSITFFVIALLGYAIFEARYLILGPKITTISPSQGFMSDIAPFFVEGRAQNIVRISLNDRPIFVDEEGHFKEKLLLQKGYTIMTLRAEDRFGRSTEEFLYLAHN